MNKSLVIAEMACSHEGDLNLAKKILDAAAVAKADAIQLQIWSLIHMDVSSKKGIYELSKKLSLVKKQWKDLHYTQKKNTLI